MLTREVLISIALLFVPILGMFVFLTVPPEPTDAVLNAGKYLIVAIEAVLIISAAFLKK